MGRVQVGAQCMAGGAIVHDVLLVSVKPHRKMLFRSNLYDLQVEIMVM